jgi:hypothetical protein
VDQEVAKTLGELELKLQELERELTSIGHRDGQAQPKAPGTLIDEAVESEGRPGGQPGGQPDAPERNVTPGHEPPGTGKDARLDGEDFGGPAVFGGEEVPAQGGTTVERDWTTEIRETAYGEIPTPPSPPSPAPPSPAPPSPGPEPSPTPQPPAPAPPEPAPPTTPPGAPPEPPPGLYHPSSPPGVYPPSSPPGVYPPSSPPGVHPPSSSREWPPPPDPRRSDAVEESKSVDLAELVRFRDKLARTMDELIDEYSRLLPVEPLPPRRPEA